eukprot:1108536-Pyramimonas_sp.AAC.1
MSGAPPSLAARLYNRRALPVLGYLQQLAATPKMLLAKEGWAVAKLWRMPPQALGRHDFLALGAWAPGLRIRSLLATGCAAAMRSALST